MQLGLQGQPEPQDLREQTARQGQRAPQVQPVPMAQQEVPVLLEPLVQVVPQVQPERQEMPEEQVSEAPQVQPEQREPLV